MEESEANRIIVDAKRKAKVHARATGESHQKSLDHVARMMGREDWAAFLKDPAEDAPNHSSGWRGMAMRHAAGHRRLYAASATGFVVATLVVVNLRLAERAGAIPFKVPFLAWAPFAAIWAVAGAIFAMSMLVLSFRTIRRMSSGMVDTMHAWILVMTILLVFVGVQFWSVLEGSAKGGGSLIPSLVTWVVSWGIIVLMLFSMPRKGKGRSGRKSSE